MFKITTAALVAGMLAFTAVPANAGCLTGALVGGIAGHFLGHHGFMGAAAGCAGGVLLKRHEQNQRYNAYGRPNYYNNNNRY